MTCFSIKGNDHRPMKNVGVFFFAPAVFMGFISGFSPYAIGILFVFFVFLSIFCGNRKHVLSLGLIFIGALILTKFILVNDVFYMFFGNPRAIKVYELVYQVLSVIFILIGILNLLDWLRLKMRSDDIRLLIKYPSFLNPVNTGSALRKDNFYHGLANKRRSGPMIFNAVLLGMLCAVIESLWPQDYLFFVQNAFYLAQGKNLIVRLRLFIYVLFYAWPFWLLWLGAMKASRSDRSLLFISRHLSILKIIFSALFISVGAALLYIING